jgi:thioredoxin-dependent peroxiredoxin
VESHKRFREKYSLNFPLLADVGGALSQAFGAFSGGVSSRSTFLLDKEGKVARVYAKVKVDGHVVEVLEALASL